MKFAVPCASTFVAKLIKWRAKASMPSISSLSRQFKEGCSKAAQRYDGRLVGELMQPRDRQVAHREHPQSKLYVE